MEDIKQMKMCWMAKQRMKDFCMKKRRKNIITEMNGEQL